MKRKTYRIAEVVEALGLSRTTIYILIGEGKLDRIKIGASTLIAAESIDRLLQRPVG
ncbi:helix-turn-helix domain-containing protein [Novosphingopyxis sp. YJ-S2-01]|uniref:helix-turn-helix domain-containing protein n=1 Tax=Novosphingopyxis sp. YJ-S2-01 TaxID=2794021 RepID=UPI0018DC2C77|nr:helix-turn-helix domain-containing protein [Novosphingopyxis sp. YJ-S2-01]MBH9537198.1 helix-turn-helix domain-containing protein [Novosphingopyxis sp. YJ-S2-01]